MRKQIDIVHSFGRLAALAPVLRHRKIAKIQSYQRNGVPWNSVKIAAKIAKSSIVFTGCSSSVYRDRPGGSSSESQWRTIFNGVDMAKYVFSPAVAVDAPLICLGRVEQIKGVHNAIAIAQAARRRLVIAGNRVDCGPGGRYFETEIAPHLDGRQIEYVGPVNDEQKNRLLGDCAALLMPIEWEEPFGIVMAEAMACGTPVIGFMRGSVPELIRDGVNGFTGRTLEEAVAAVYRLSEIDRRQVRRDCEIRFGSDVIVDAYERLYLEASLK